MGKYSNLFFVDCEAEGRSPLRGKLTEFAVIHYESGTSYHGRIYESRPDPSNPAKPIAGERISPDIYIAIELSKFIFSCVHNKRAVMVSDNPAYDFMWIAALFDKVNVDNPFGHSARRISDFYAGLTRDFSNTQDWKKLRQTPHDHNPLNDAMGNVEAFRSFTSEILKEG